ncbi:MAG: hypothetical protein Q9160_006150 [Pyrenula sp. 1 TL-2023]
MAHVRLRIRILGGKVEISGVPKWDAFDFFTVSLTVTEVAKDFGVANSDVSWLWAVASPFLSFDLNKLTPKGLFGPAAATALEDLPYEARGLLSGLFEQGYATGYLLAALFYRALVPTTSHGWRSLFWFGAGPPILIIAYRWWLPETNYFQAILAEREARLSAEKHGDVEAAESNQGLRAYLRETARAARQNWVLLIYMVRSIESLETDGLKLIVYIIQVILMSGFNACSHGSQDLYPTYLKNVVELSPSNVTIVTVIGQIGALIGATILGFLSTFTGRRLTMIIACIFGGALIPAYILPRSMALVASAWAEQFFVGGVWGPIPIHLVELSPPQIRATSVGLTYQLGNLASSASATIQSVIGERYPLPGLAKDGTKRFDYGRVIAIFMGGVWAYQLFFLFLGPEMSEEERMEFSRESEQLERMRKEGIAVAEYGKERVRLERKALDAEDGGAKEAEKVDVEQVEDR